MFLCKYVYIIKQLGVYCIGLSAPEQAVKVCESEQIKATTIEKIVHI